MGLFLQIFLLVNVFLIGVGVAIGARHLYAHYRPQPEVKKTPAPEQAVRLSAQTRELLIKEAENTYRDTLTKTTTTLVKDLEQTATALNVDLQKVGTKIIDDQLLNFKQTLNQIHSETQTASTAAIQDIAALQAEAKAKMEAEIQAEKTRLLEQIDTKLADGVVAFLIETLQHDVDLGAQTKYLTKMLDEHKADFASRVNNEN